MFIINSHFLIKCSQVLIDSLFVSSRLFPLLNILWGKTLVLLSRIQIFRVRKSPVEIKKFSNLSKQTGMNPREFYCDLYS